jgi:hypothetical protein
MGCVVRSFTLLLAVVVVGCATPGPQLVQPPRLITDSNARLEAMGFSILPPSGPHWYLYIRGAAWIAFAKRDPEHYKQASDRTHTFAVTALIVSAANADIKTMEGLTQVLDNAIGRTDPSRFKIVSRRLDPYREQETDCVRFEMVNEEWNNPHAPGVLFQTSTAGKMCRNPVAPEYVAMAIWSERLPKGHESMLDARLREEVNHSLESLAFAAVR